MPLQPTELLLGSHQSRHTPAATHVLVPSSRQSRRHLSYHAQGALDWVGSRQGPTQVAGHRQPHHCQPLLQTFTKARRRIRVHPIQPPRRPLQRYLGGRVVGLLARLRQPTPQLRQVLLGHMSLDVSPLVHLATLDHGIVAQTRITAARRALPPSSTNSVGRPVSRPRSLRSSNNAVQTAAFSVALCRRPSSRFVPS